MNSDRSPVNPNLNRRRLLIAALGCLAACGCERQRVFEVEYDADLARRTLFAALDAWQAKDVSSLGKRESPIRFVDEDQKSGFQLVAYGVVHADQPLRPFEGVAIRLVLRQSNGAPREQIAFYQVTLTPELAVLRSDP